MFRGKLLQEFLFINISFIDISSKFLLNLVIRNISLCVNIEDRLDNKYNEYIKYEVVCFS